LGFVGDLLRSTLRSEMKQRTEEILVSVRGVQQSLDAHRAVLERLLLRLESDASTSKELAESTRRIVKSEKHLASAVKCWTNFMERTVEELK